MDALLSFTDMIRDFHIHIRYVVAVSIQFHCLHLLSQQLISWCIRSQPAGDCELNDSLHKPVKCLPKTLEIGALWVLQDIQVMLEEPRHEFPEKEWVLQEQDEELCRVGLQAALAPVVSGVETKKPVVVGLLDHAFPLRICLHCVEVVQVFPDAFPLFLIREFFYFLINPKHKTGKGHTLKEALGHSGDEAPPSLQLAFEWPPRLPRLGSVAAQV